MTQTNKYLAFILIALSGSIYAAGPKSYWQCSAQDGADKTWTAKSSFQKSALNIAFANCKKESTAPATCKLSESSCEGFNLDFSNKPSWRCTALDQKAEAWRSNVYIHRDDAAFAAKAFCKERSAVPESCYTNFVTCIDSNEGVSN